MFDMRVSLVSITLAAAFSALEFERSNARLESKPGAILLK